MIATNQIEKNLEKLDKAYKGSTDPLEIYFSSKLAILEVCGWIEEAIDEIIISLANNTLTDTSNIESVKASVKRTYGFLYESHFKNLMITLIGVVNFEKVESGIGDFRKERLRALLRELSEIRNLLAHTHTMGTTRRIDSPSIMLNKLKEVHIGLSQFESECLKLFRT